MIPALPGILIEIEQDGIWHAAAAVMAWDDLGNPLVASQHHLVAAADLMAVQHPGLTWHISEGADPILDALDDIAQAIKKQ